MKRIVVILTLVISCTAYSQQLESKQIYLGAGSTATDTLNYLKTFETNKSKYIGKAFSVLLSDMGKVQPKLVMPGSGQALNAVNVSPFARFVFANRSDLYSYEVPIMRIVWKDPLPADEVVNYRIKNNAFFTTEEKNYYSNKIVMNISVYMRKDLK